jgi:hypothetical protein
VSNCRAFTHPHVANCFTSFLPYTYTDADFILSKTICVCVRFSSLTPSSILDPRFATASNSFFEMGENPSLYIKKKAYGFHLFHYFRVQTSIISSPLECQRNTKEKYQTATRVITATQKAILCTSRQPHRLYISRATVSNRLHPEFMFCRSSTGLR